MDEAIEALERGGEGEEIGYVAIAKKFGVDESTLRRRHQGRCSTHVEAAQEQKNLSTQQEEELVKYIKDLTSKGLPSSRAMTQNFASVVAKKEVGKSWVLPFLNKHKDTFSPK
jgi:transposase-like protein